MLKRTLTGAVILLVTALMILSRNVSIYFFDFFVMAISFVATYEIIKVNLKEEEGLELPIKNVSYIYLPLIYCYLNYLSYSFAPTILHAIIYQLAAFLVVVLVAFVWDLIYLSKLRKANIELPKNLLLRGTKLTALTMFYPITLIGTLYGFGIVGMNSMLGTTLVITIIAITMCTDVFAYLFGMAFHKGVLASQISPKKSISGAIGGLVGGIVASASVFLVCQFLLTVNPFDVYPLSKVITFFALSGVLGSVFVQIGDLVASAIKRKADIKDFGKIFPGHGGMMDRMDGMMFASTLILVLSILLLFI